MFYTIATKCFFCIFKGHHCFYQEHLKGRQKEQTSNRNKKELVPNNKKITIKGIQK